MTFVSLVLRQVFDSGGELSDCPPTMFHPKLSSPQLQQHHEPNARIAASASPALPLPLAANAALPSHNRLPSSLPTLSSDTSPSPILIPSANQHLQQSSPPPQQQQQQQQQHRVTQMQLVRSSGNITVVSAAPVVSGSTSSSSSSRIDSAQSGTNISVTTAPAPDIAAAALAEQLMAKMQVRVRRQRRAGAALCSLLFFLMRRLLQLEFNARLEAERENFTKQMIAMQHQMQQQQLQQQQQQQQQFELMMKVTSVFCSCADVTRCACCRWV
jgi:hypothetical protein